MADALAHRGPDGEGYLRARGRVPAGRGARRWWPANLRAIAAGLAHRRLTIIDPTQDSAQPMRDASGRFTLVYNGELYNYVELRTELERAGRTLRTAGDTEVVLQAWVQWGPSCLERFVGMWAFAILDLERRQLVLCRDRFGIKPLFYTQTGGALRFASEIKGLLAAMPTPEPDEAIVAGFLSRQADTGPQTFFRGHPPSSARPPARVALDDPVRASCSAIGRSRAECRASRRRRGGPVRRAFPRQRPHPHPQRRARRDLLERRPRLLVDRLHGLDAEGATASSRHVPPSGLRLCPAGRIRLRAAVDGHGRRSHGHRARRGAADRERFEASLRDDRAPAGRAVRLDQHRGAVVRLRGGRREPG